MMRISWIFAEGYQLSADIDAEKVKAVGSTWGSWRTWRSCSTDNVICHQRSSAQDLIARAFQSVCNFYIPAQHYQDLKRPIGVKLYHGAFDQEVDHIEDIIAMHLVSTTSDLVLLVGFDFSPLEPVEDQFEQHKIKNYHGLIHSMIKSNPAVEWILIDHVPKLDKAYQSLPNLTCDKMKNALQLLM
jgi:hypothetical protein